MLAKKPAPSGKPAARSTLPRPERRLRENRSRTHCRSRSQTPCPRGPEPRRDEAMPPFKLHFREPARTEGPEPRATTRRSGSWQDHRKLRCGPPAERRCTGVMVTDRATSLDVAATDLLRLRVDQPTCRAGSSIGGRLVVFGGDRDSGEFIAFWGRDQRVLAGIFVNVWDVNEPSRH